jgi:uncharacterized protein YbaP (TraB family)
VWSGHNFKRFALAFLATALLGSCAARPGHERHFLWVLAGEHNRVYVMGSFHLLRPQDYPLAAEIEDAYRDAEALCMEIDVDDTDEGALAFKMLALARLPPGASLKTELGDSYPMVSSKARALGIDLAPLDAFQPWFVALTASVTQLMKLGFNPNEGVEKYFQRRAKTDHKEICGFETAEDQFNLLAGMSAHEQAALLAQSIDELGDVQTQMNAMLDAWKHGDEKTLLKTAFRQMEQNPELYKAMILDRNKRFAAGIEGLLGERHDYLVIVGAGHLVGRDSVLRMLRKDGHRAKQL